MGQPLVRSWLIALATRHIRSFNLPGGDIPAKFARIAFAEVKSYPGGKTKIKVIITHALIPELALPYYRRALAEGEFSLESLTGSRKRA
ncbi:hypothetical protein [Succinimonas sp.]|uniref:hypothetical protein n=1 Tax=Succinimonas sp. TaxID=1936151 RepID=UPI00386E9187